ncbi:MAG: response regulator [Legionella sp.]
MSFNPHNGHVDDAGIIHKYYMDIINAMPDIVYWVDINCHLTGCNNQFVNLLGLHELRDFNGTPYQQMKKFAHWPEARIEALKLDDMHVIFSGKPRYGVEEKPIVNEKNKTFYFKSTRVPLFDEHKNVAGLVVILSDINALKQAQQQINVVANGSSTTAHTMPTHLPHVLMIEDNIIAQNVEKALLQALDCEVDIAESGDKALKLFDPGKYDLVLMDIGLEDTSGYVIAKKLRHMEKDTEFHVPIIALTGFAADVVKYDCEQYSMQGAITKPLTSEQAEQIIKHYVYHQDVPVSGLKSTLN